MRWRVPSRPGSIRWRRWDEDVAVRVESTGGTHLLGPAAGCAFTVLLGAPSGMDLRQLADTMLDGAEPGDLERLDAMLLELHRLGVIEQVPA